MRSLPIADLTRLRARSFLLPLIERRKFAVLLCSQVTAAASWSASN
jgi:hypothetical protein